MATIVDRSALLVLAIATLLAAALPAATLTYGSVETAPGQPEKVEEKDGAAFCWLATMDGVPIYADAACKKEQRKAAFLEEFYSLWRKDDVVLLVKGQPDPSGGVAVTEVVGYARQSDLLESKNNVYQCLRSENRIARKALVVHKWAKGSAVTEKAGLRTSPDLKAPEKGEVNLYSILYVHAFSNKETGKETDPAGFCLVATRPNLEVRQPDIHSQSFLGWLPNSRVFFWDHRQAIEYDKSPEGAKWRRDAKRPIQFFIDAEDFEAGRPAMQEDLSKGPWPYYLQRYPILSSAPAMVGNTECYWIGVIGDSYSASQKDKVMVEAALEAQIRQKLEELNVALGDLEVLFVIDATGSMSQYYQSIKESIARIQAGLEKGREKPLRYAVLFYRDYTEAQDRDSWDHHFVDFAVSSEFAAKFPHVQSQGGNDNPSMLWAIHTGLEMASFSEKSMRAVILIGDMGNEQPDARGFTVEKAIEALNRKQCMFYAIQAIPESTHLKRQLFDDQVQQIYAALKMPEARVFNADGSDVSQAIVSSVGKSSEMAVMLQKALDILKEGKGSFSDAIAQALTSAGIQAKGDPGQAVSLNFGDYGTWMEKELFKRLESQQIDTKVFVEKRIQHFGLALAPVKLPGAPAPSFVTRTLLLRSEFQQLTSVLGVVLRRALTPGNCQEVWRQAVNQLSGDLDQEVTFDESRPLSDYMMMALGIPVRSELLKKSVLELMRMPPEKVAELRTSLQKLWEQQNNYNAKLTADGKASESHWFLMHGLEYGWIPIELMP